MEVWGKVTVVAGRAEGLLRAAAGAISSQTRLA